MREFQFSLVYDEGVNDYVDFLRDHGTLRSEALVSCLDPNEFWRLELVTGDRDALAAADPLLEDETVDRESISGRNSQADRHHSVLESDASHRVLYTHATEIQYHDAVPTVAAQYLDGGALFEVVREGATATWRVLVRDDERVGMMYDAVTGRLADAVSVEFDSVERAEGWHNPLAGRVSLPEEQRETLELAVERGYFEEPRAVSVDELASELGVARSTASYRLRRATAALTEAYVDGWY